MSKAGQTAGRSRVEIALCALEAVANDPEAPAAARAQAARTLLEVEGRLGRHAKPPEEEDAKALSTMTRAELLAEMQALRGNYRTGAG